MSTTDLASSFPRPSWRQRFVVWLSLRWTGLLPESNADLVLSTNEHHAHEATRIALGQANARIAALEVELDLERALRRSEGRKHEAEVDACRHEVKLLAEVVERDRLRVQAEQAGYAVQVAMAQQPKEAR